MEGEKQESREGGALPRCPNQFRADLLAPLAGLCWTVEIRSYILNF